MASLSGLILECLGAPDCGAESLAASDPPAISNLFFSELQKMWEDWLSLDSDAKAERPQNLPQDPERASSGVSYWAHLEAGQHGEQAHCVDTAPQRAFTKVLGL